MNLRNLINTSSAPERPYYEFNREERHLAGILFFILNQPGILERALTVLDCSWKINPKQFGIYLEYSYARDLWHAMNTKPIDLPAVNRRKSEAILQLLATAGEPVISAFSPVHHDVSTRDFNAFFVDEHRASREYIQSPANWNLKRLAENIPDNNEALAAACRLKWAFRVKPDLVINIDNQHALCLELKLESIEGTYPASGAERKLLRDRKMYGSGLTFPMQQTKLQRFLMKEILGLECLSRFITRSGTVKPECISWSELLDSLNPLPDLPAYMQAALTHARHNLLSPREVEEGE